MPDQQEIRLVHPPIPIAGSYSLLQMALGGVPPGFTADAKPWLCLPRVLQ